MLQVDTAPCCSLCSSSFVTAVTSDFSKVAEASELLSKIYNRVAAPEDGSELKSKLQHAKVGHSYRPFSTDLPCVSMPQSSFHALGSEYQALQARHNLLKWMSHSKKNVFEHPTETEMLQHGEVAELLIRR